MDLLSWRPEVLALGSGGLKGLNILGAVFWFWSNGMLDTVHSYIGSSIGAILNTLLLLGYTPREILEHSLETRIFKDFSDIKWADAIDQFGLFSNATFDDELAKKMTSLIVAKLGKVPTLQELYQLTKKRIIFVVVSLKQETAIYMDHISHPDWNLLACMRATSNTPIIFGKLGHQKDYIVDGAVLDPLPVLHLDDGRTPILAIGVQDKRTWNFDEITMLNYYDRIMSLPLREMTNFAIANASDQCMCIVIPVTDDMSMLDDAKNPQRRVSMFQEGFRHTEYFVEHYLPSKPLKCEKEIPLSRDAINACLKTHAVKTILKCMKDDPSLFEQCMRDQDIPIPKYNDVKKEPFNDMQEIRIPVSHVVKDTSDETYGHDMQLITVEQAEEDDDIIEIPRMPEFDGGYNSGIPPHPRGNFMDDMIRNIYGTRMGMQGNAIIMRMDIDESVLRRVFQTGASVYNVLSDTTRMLRYLQDLNQ
jgi:predicted acylesterase/phospholipase RssA